VTGFLDVITIVVAADETETAVEVTSQGNSGGGPVEEEGPAEYGGADSPTTTTALLLDA
jgi:hypothetical protein